MRISSLCACAVCARHDTSAPLAEFETCTTHNYVEILPRVGAIAVASFSRGLFVALSQRAPMSEAGVTHARHE